MSNLQRHVPRLALEWARNHPEDRWRRYDGTLCFADISGFTALAERLAERGRVGGEELVDTLGRVFGEMLDVARDRGGSLLKFGGDALLLFYYGEDHATQAAAAAVEMRDVLRRARTRRTSVGPLKLSMSVGLHSGPVDLFLVGGTHSELVVLGPSAEAVVAVEGAASAGEILVSGECAARLPRAAVRPRKDGQRLLRWRRKLPPAPDRYSTEFDYEPLAPALFPGELGKHLAEGPPEPGHRVACIGFIGVSGTNRVLEHHGPGHLAHVLHDTVSAVQRVLVDEGVTLLAVDIDRDGCKFFLAAGVPYALEDDEGVMLRGLRRIMDLSLPLSLQAGVSRGHVFTVEVGSARRAAYSAMGDTTNTAARIAAKTPPGRIYAHPSVLDESLTRFEVVPAGPLSMKGKALPQQVYDVGAEIGLREREGLDTGEFIGRAIELAAFREVALGLSPEGGCTVTLTGGTGVGKSRLMREAVNRLDLPMELTLRAEPYGADNPYRMFRDPLRQLIGLERGDPDRMRSELTRRVGQLDRELLAWLPLIGDVVRVSVDVTPEVDSLAPEFRPGRTADAVVRLITAACPGRLAITVDDTHWADDASAELLAAIEGATAHRPWLLVATRRDVEGGFQPKSEVIIDVPPMSEAEIRELVQELTEAAPLRPQVIDRIVARSAGVPLFANELVVAVRDIGTLEVLPESLEAALAAQIDALDEPAQRALRYASVLGRSFSEEILMEVYASQDQELPAGLLERLDRFLEEESPGRFRFRNALLRDTVYEGITFRLRARLHRTAGVAMEQRAANPEDIAHDLALHCFRGEDFPRALRFAMAAGHRSRRAYANAEAASLFEIALAAARRQKARPRQLLEIWQALGEVRDRAGFVDAALDAYRQAMKLVRDEPERKAELLYDLAWAKQRAGRLTSAMRSVNQGLRLIEEGLGDGAATRARLESLKAMILFVGDRPARALKAAKAAVVTARAAGDREALVRLLNVMETSQLVLLGKSDGAHLREALEIAESLGNRGQQAMLASTLSALLFYDNRWNEAIDSYRSAHSLYEAAGNYLEGAYMLVNMGEILSRQGRLAEAHRQLSRALRIMRASDFPEGIANCEMELARVALLEGDAAEAYSLAAQAAGSFTGLNEPHFALQANLIRAEALLHRDEPETALSVVDEAVRTAGSEAGYLRSKTAITRARVLIALARAMEAEQEIESGLQVAEEQGALHDQAQLLRLRDTVSRALELGARVEDQARADEILTMLGAVG